MWGNVLVGPTAEDLDDRTDTGTTADGLAGLLAAGERILPALVDEEVTATYAGLRAATEHRDYQIRLHAELRYVTVGGIRSTGLTASPAIAEHVAGLLAGAGARWSGGAGGVAGTGHAPAGRGSRSARPGTRRGSPPIRPTARCCATASR